MVLKFIVCSLALKVTSRARVIAILQLSIDVSRCNITLLFNLITTNLHTHYPLHLHMLENPFKLVSHSMHQQLSS
jgi:hypothetical protein